MGENGIYSKRDIRLMKNGVTENYPTGGIRHVKRAGIITKILVFAVIIFLAWTIVGLRADIAGATAERDALRSQAAALEVANDEMQRRIDNRDSDEVKAEIAREEFGLAMPGEEIIYD